MTVTELLDRAIKQSMVLYGEIPNNGKIEDIIALLVTAIRKVSYESKEAQASEGRSHS